ncbi:MAG: hypothetical protein BJ554DRAFT_2049, partial [Olpidium bornovanus]
PVRLPSAACRSRQEGVRPPGGRRSARGRPGCRLQVERPLRAGATEARDAGRLEAQRRGCCPGRRSALCAAPSEYASKFLPDEIRSAMIEGAEEQRTKIRVFPPPRKAREEGKDKKFFTWPHELKERYYEQYLAAEKMLAERRSAAVRPAEDGAGSEEPAGEAARWVAGADAETTAAGGANEWAAADVPAADEDVPVGPAVHALAARIGVVTPDIKNVAHVLQRTREGGRYSYLGAFPAKAGRNALAMYVSEYLHMKYPLLPDHVMSRAITAYIGHAALATLGYEWGVNHAGKFEVLTVREACALESTRTVRDSTIRQKSTTADVRVESTRRQDLTKLEEREVDCEIMADVVRGLVGVFAAHPGLRVLLTAPVRQAARTALREHYATEVKDIQLPSDTLIEPGARYVAQPVGQTPADWRF